MENCILCRGISSIEKQLKSNGFKLGNPTHKHSSCSITIDNADYAGGIIHWPASRFEFHFVQSYNGEDAILETHHFSEVNTLIDALNDLLFRRLEITDDI